jgi:formate/nitrite transporter FocA (FNT family)
MAEARVVPVENVVQVACNLLGNLFIAWAFWLRTNNIVTLGKDSQQGR